MMRPSWMLQDDLEPAHHPSRHTNTFPPAEASGACTYALSPPIPRTVEMMRPSLNTAADPQPHNMHPQMSSSQLLEYVHGLEMQIDDLRRQKAPGDCVLSRCWGIPFLFCGFHVHQRSSVINCNRPCLFIKALKHSPGSPREFPIFYYSSYWYPCRAWILQSILGTTICLENPLCPFIQFQVTRFPFCIYCRVCPLLSTLPNILSSNKRMCQIIRDSS